MPIYVVFKNDEKDGLGAYPLAEGTPGFDIPYEKIDRTIMARAGSRYSREWCFVSADDEEKAVWELNLRA